MTDGTFMAYRDAGRLRQSTLDVIAGINQILAENDGYVMTVRGIHYQFVAKGWEANNGKTYSLVQGAINTGRMAGLISWTAVEDLGRNLRGLNSYENPEQALRRTRAGYRIDMWANQPFRPEFWVEKQAQEGNISRIANELEVDYYAQKGYDSQSQSWRAGQRFARYIAKGQIPIVFHFGDHDPSGLQMTEDNRRRLEQFTGVPIQVVRLALNHDQVLQYDPPPNPVKQFDSRADDYIAKFGRISWEMDALRPQVMHQLARDAIERIRDNAAWEQQKMVEVEDRRRLDELMAIMGQSGGDDVDES